MRVTLALDIELDREVEPEDVGQSLMEVREALRNGALSGRVRDISGENIGRWALTIPEAVA